MARYNEKYPERRAGDPDITDEGMVRTDDSRVSAKCRRPTFWFSIDVILPCCSEECLAGLEDIEAPAIILRELGVSRETPLDSSIA